MRVAPDGVPIWNATLFTIKICGISSVKDAQVAALAGADAIGLNFYDKSPRNVDLETAQKIASALPSKVAKVGLFVNAEAAAVTSHVESLDLDWIQLHGDEPPEYIRDLPECSILRAVRFSGENASELGDFIRRCNEVRELGAILVDAHKEGTFGGTGETVDWSSLAECRSALGEQPLVLAGGLTPFNVEDAISAVRPQAVDVANGVESSPGRKDLLLVRAFTNAAKKAFAAIASQG